MNKHIRLTKKITLEDIVNKKISHIEAYSSQITACIINPCRELDSLRDRNTDNGMAIWVLLLTFFEPHGQYLTGINSNGKSKDIFIVGFDEFKKFIIQKKLVEIDVKNLESEKLFKFARSGLFHSSVMYKDFLIDCINFSRYSISRNPFNGGWLINPWLFTEDLSRYVEFYLKEVKDDVIKKRKFESTFERLILNPMMKMVNK